MVCLLCSLEKQMWDQNISGSKSETLLTATCNSFSIGFNTISLLAGTITFTELTLLHTQRYF